MDATDPVVMHPDDDVPPTLALIALPVAELFTLCALVAALVRRPRSIGPVVLASVGAGLAALWVVRGYHLGVEADATGGRNSIFEDFWWLVAVVVFAGASLLLARRHATAVSPS